MTSLLCLSFAFYRPYKMNFSCPGPLAESISLLILPVDHENLPQGASCYCSTSVSGYPKLKILPNSNPKDGLRTVLSELA